MTEEEETTTCMECCHMDDAVTNKLVLFNLIYKLFSFAKTDAILSKCDISFTEERPLEEEDDGSGGYRLKQSGPHTLSIRISDPTKVGEYVK